MSKSPCYDPVTDQDCINRCTGCSAICALWHEYERNRNEKYKERYKKKHADRVYIEHHKDLNKRTKKWRNTPGRGY